MLVLILICICCFLILVWHSRLFGMTIGLPIAYLFALLLQHLPGGFAHLAGGYFFEDSATTEIGLRFTTIGTCCFVIGAVFAQRRKLKCVRKIDPRWLQRRAIHRFAVICLVSGWFVALMAILLGSIPSLGAAIEQAGSIWIIGVLIGLLIAVRNKHLDHILLWLAALAVYPVLVLIKGGFLSFGSTSIFAVLAALLVKVRSQILAYAGVVLFSLFSFLAFMSYFQNRDSIRSAVWGGDTLSQRVIRSTSIITDIKWFDSNNIEQLKALDQRLNQNAFAGSAAQKIASGQVQFLYGRSIWEGFQALVPRAIWPGKPIFAGSSDLIREMTDFYVNETTTFGVGQVMEFYINFGITSLVVGFLLFGYAYGWIDRNATIALHGGDYGRALLWFLPGIGMLAPLASISEVMGNVAAALVAACAWRYLWEHYGVKRPAKGRRRKRRHGRMTRPHQLDVTEGEIPIS